MIKSLGACAATSERKKKKRKEMDSSGLSINTNIDK